MRSGGSRRSPGSRPPSASPRDRTVPRCRCTTFAAWRCGDAAAAPVRARPLARRSARVARSRRAAGGVTMEISVVIVTLGGSRLLHRCIASIAEGRVAAAEIVLVDQGPGDDLEEIRSLLAGSAVELVHVAIDDPASRRPATSARQRPVATTSHSPTTTACRMETGSRRWWRGWSADDVLAATGRVLPLEEGRRRAGRRLAAHRSPRAHVRRRRALCALGDRNRRKPVDRAGHLQRDRRVQRRLRPRREVPGGRGHRAARAGDRPRAASIRYSPAAIVYHELKRPSGGSNGGSPTDSGWAP